MPAPQILFLLMGSIDIHKRLPPGQKLRTDFPVLHYGDVPEISISEWKFRVKGLIKNDLIFTYKDFLKLPSVELVTDFHCVTGWSKFDLKWKGVLFKTIALLAEPLLEARFVNILAYGGYSTNLPLEVAMDDDVIFAYEYDGKTLTPEHGYPLRLVVPKRYAYKSAKWVREVEFLKEDRPGFWEVRGYSNTADPWKEERYA
ncbi:MAG: sulfite oxidase-like oxidoreductase [Thermodesulfovibrionales bacterium]|nr:sulfite oxidase-like oxidoreductase [Thermodesulfovibrionales bacterium]